MNWPLVRAFQLQSPRLGTWQCTKQTEWPKFPVDSDQYVIMIEAVAITRDWLELHRYERRSDENYVPGYEFAGTVVYASSSAGKAHVGKQAL